MIMSGQFTIRVDKTGFPLISMPGRHFYISLFPVSKFQFEQFLASAGTLGGKYTDAWYRETIAPNPRSAWQNGSVRPWQHILTGLSEEAIEDFMIFLGPGYRLPTSSEWRTLHRESTAISSSRDLILADLADRGAIAPPVHHWIKSAICPMTARGALERVTDSGRLHCIGRPHPDWHGNAWDAEQLRSVTNEETMKKLVGFRVAVPADCL